MASLKSKKLFTAVRPPRVACLVNQHDDDWQQTCMRVIEFFSRVWGGGHNIIIPTDGNTISDPFWKILEAYDADYIYYYLQTGTDFKARNPDEYRARLEKEVKNYLNGQPFHDEKQARDYVDGLLQHEMFTPAPTPEFGEAIRNRLSPFHLLGDVIRGLWADVPVRDPLTSIPTLLKGCDERPKIGVLEPIRGGIYPLWLASVFGLASDGLHNDLAPFHTSFFPLSTEDHVIDLLTNPRIAADLLSPESLFTPFKLSNLKLSMFWPARTRLPQSLALVAGETFFDFCLFYSLSRMRQPVLWLPSQWLKSESVDVSANLFNEYCRNLRWLLRDPNTSDKGVLTSYSLKKDELDDLLVQLDRGSFIRLNDLSSQITVDLDLSGLVSHPLRAFETGPRPTMLEVQESSEMELFETPKPKGFPSIQPYEHRWIADVIIAGHYLPRNSNLGEWVIRSPILGRPGSRVGSDGALSYFCPNIGYPGGDVDSILVRPTIFVPSALELFQRLCWTIGYEAKLSDKGFFAQHTISKFGGLDALAGFLSDAFARALILKFLDESSKGSATEGWLLKDGRRYLTLPSVSQVLQFDSTSQKTLDLLISKGVLYRGCIFKCGACRNADWFGLDEFSQVFKCKRCGTTQHVSKENYWYAEHEPGWCYKLDEIIYQFLRHDGYVGVLALGCLKGRADNSFLFTTDLELIKKDSTARKPEFELDILAVLDGELALGEAKKGNRLGETAAAEKNEIRKYCRLAKELVATKLVFATFSDAWSAETLKNLERATSNLHLDVMLLTGSDLRNASSYQFK